jgi:hypothetical protein
MNIKLHHVFSDLDGQSAQRIIEHIIAGERNADILWDLRDSRCRSTKEKFLASLQGDWRDEYIFVLKECNELRKESIKAIKRSDKEIEKLLLKIGSIEENPPNNSDVNSLPSGKKKSKGKNDLSFDIHSQAERFYGVDLTNIDGVGSGLLATLMSELGNATRILKAFKTGQHFVSYLGLCPNNKISGGRVLGSKTRSNANRVSQALRMAAQALTHSKSSLGEHCRRMKGRLGKIEGTTAVAHKLGRIIYAMIKSREPYNEQKVFKLTQKAKNKRLKWIHKQAKKLGMQLVPVQ